MSIFKKQQLIASYPAFDVYKREANEKGLVNITVDDILVKPDHLGKYQAGSIVSFALEYNECPIKAVEECRQKMIDQPHNGHKLHWIMSLGGTISNSPTKKINVIEVDYGMEVVFEGHIATIEKANNGNLQFKEIEATDD